MTQESIALHLSALADEGYTVIRAGIAPGEIDAIVSRMRQIHAARKPAYDIEQPFLNRGHDTLYNLQR